MIPSPGPDSAIEQNFRDRLLAMLGLCFVIVMVALDQTVIGTALPTVVAELRGFQLYAWVGTAYLLTTIITVPIFGKLGDEHGRKRFVLTRLPSPNVMLYVGLVFFCAAVLLLTQTIIVTPHAVIYSAMLLAGMGLGLLLPNLTLFAQASVQRTQLGVATAMMQSMRMIGGMLGMAIIGTLITQGYNRGVNDMLQAGNGEQWRDWLGDPQVLVDRALADRFSAAVLRGGEDAAVLLEGARLGLVDAIHASHWLIAAVVALSLLVVRRLPAMSLDPAAARAEGGHE